MQGLLNAIPVFFANEYGIRARAGNEQGFVVSGRFIEEAVKFLPRLAGIHTLHFNKRTLFRTLMQETLEQVLGQPGQGTRPI